MSRRDEKRQAYASMIVPGMQKKADTIRPDQKVCGTCRHFSENAYSSDGRGSCSFLKAGSDISRNPPVYITEGREGYFANSLTDAGNCQYYEKMKMIDKDGYECSDPQYRRSNRQFQ